MISDSVLRTTLGSTGVRGSARWPGGLLICCLLGLVVLSRGSQDGVQAGTDAPPSQGAAEGSTPRSVILMIGDGMGPQEIGLFLDVSDAIDLSPSAIERAYGLGTISLIRTGSANSPVTDSAASATALATGVNTRNGFVGVDPQGAILPNCLEDAQRSGRQTAIVTTTRLSHATPACFIAHERSRDAENSIARQAVTSGIDIMLGGGAIHFLGGVGGQEIASEIRAGGYQLVRTARALADAPREGRLLGLFSADNLPFRVDRDGGDGEPTYVPSLKTMTEAALERLDADRGFFLMIEGGRIDHAGHANDAGTLVGEMREFDDTVAVVLDYIAAHPDVALLITADHETGGLCFTYRGSDFPSNSDLRLLANTPASAKAKSQEEITDESALAFYGSARLPFVPKETWAWNVPALERSVKSFVSFGSQGHSATPVVMLHVGPGARFPALTDHASVGRQLRTWMASPVAKRSEER